MLHTFLGPRLSNFLSGQREEMLSEQPSLMGRICQAFSFHFLSWRGKAVTEAAKNAGEQRRMWYSTDLLVRREENTFTLETYVTLSTNIAPIHLIKFKK